MKKLLAKIIGATTALAMAIGVGVGISNNVKKAEPVYATDLTYSFTIDKDDFNTTSYAANNNEKHTTAVCTTDNNVTMEVYWTSYQVYQNSNAMQWQKSKGYIYNSTNLGTVNSVTVNSSAGSFTTYYGTTEQPSSGSAGNGKGFFKTSVGGATGTTSSLVITFTKGSGPTQLSSPNPQYDSVNNKVTWTAVANASSYQVSVGDENHYATATSPYDGNFQVGTQYTVYVKAIGDGASYSDSNAGSVTFTVPTPFTPVEYALCTSVHELEAGAKYIFTSGMTGEVNAMSTESNDNNRRVTTVSVDAQTHRISSTQQTLVVELGGTEGHWTFETINYLGDDGYFASSGSNNYLKVLASAGEATISFTNSYAVINLGPSNTNKLLRYNSTNTLFSCYASGQNPVYLWKEYKELTELNVTGTPTKLTYCDSESFDPTGITAYEAVYADNSTKSISPELINWPDLALNMSTIRGSYSELGDTVYTPTYNITVSADTVTSISLTGTMTAHYYMDESWDKGNIVVTAHYLSGQTNDVTNQAVFAYYSNSEMTQQVATPATLGAGEDQTIYVKATYETVSNTTGYSQTVTVEIEHGSIESDPLTAAEAIAMVSSGSNGTETSKQYYISGVVTQITLNELGEANNWATFWLEEDNDTFGFEAFKITPDGGCTNYEDLRVGAEVLIRCKIKKYSGSIVENGSAGSLLSITYSTIELTGIALNKTTLSLATGDSFTLTASPVPVGAEFDSLVWTSSDNNVATVNQSGQVTAVGAGSATITATAGGFTATCIVNVLLKDTMEYNAGVTTNMAATGNAATVNLDSSIFSVDAAKGGNANFPGLNKDGDIRAYSGNDIIVAINSNYTITSAVFDYAAGSSSYSQIYVDNNLVAGDNGTYTINSDSFKIHSNGGQVKINSVEIFYRNATAAEKVSRSLTKTELSFHYSKIEDVYSYSNISIRFGGLVSQDLWNELDTNEHNITGFGVMITTDNIVGNAETIKEYADLGLTVMAENNNDVDNNVVDYFMPRGTGEGQMQNPPAYGNSNYLWYLYQSINYEDIDKVFVAVAYIKVGDQYVFMKQERYSVKTLAQDYLDNRGCDGSTAEGSLANLAA